MNITQMKIHKHVKTNADAFMREKNTYPVQTVQSVNKKERKTTQNPAKDLW